MIKGSREVNKKHRGRYINLKCPNCNILRWVRIEFYKNRKCDYCNKCMHILKIGKPTWNKGLTKKRDKRLMYERPTKIKKGQHLSLNTEFGQMENNPNWKGGVSALYSLIRNLSEYKLWIKKVLRKDNYNCQSCLNLIGKFHTHHIKSFRIIFREFLQQYSQFSPIEDIETLVRLAITYEPFWDMDNGKTLCEKCHQKIHPWLTIKNV